MVKQQQIFRPKLSFDDPTASEEEELYRKIYIFKEEDMTKAREKGYDEGFEKGLKKGKKEVEVEIKHVCEDMSMQIKTLSIEDEERRDSFFLSALTIAEAITKKLLPTVIEKYGIEEIHRVITEALKIAHNKTELKAQVHPSHEAALQEYVPQGITIEPDPSLERADCRVVWESGGYERLMTQVWQDIDDVMLAYTEQATSNPTFDIEQ